MIRREPREAPASPAFRRVFRAPVLLALLTATGLVAALFGAGPLRWYSWAALGTPLVLCLWYPLAAVLRRQG